MTGGVAGCCDDLETQCNMVVAVDFGQLDPLCERPFGDRVERFSGRFDFGFLNEHSGVR